MMWHTNEKVLKVGHLAVPADRTRLCFMISSRVYTSGPSTQPAAQKTDFSRRRWEKCGLTFLNAMLLFTLWSFIRPKCFNKKVFFYIYFNRQPLSMWGHAWLPALAACVMWRTVVKRASTSCGFAACDVLKKKKKKRKTKLSHTKCNRFKPEWTELNQTPASCINSYTLLPKKPMNFC